MAAIYTNGTSGTIESLSYAYDNAGYRLSQKDTIGQTITTTTYVYDKQSRLNRTAGSAPTVWDRYDAVGNLVAETVLRTQTLTYDADNELTQENDPLNHYVLYDYDHNGNRIDEVAWDGSGVH